MFNGDYHGIVDEVIVRGGRNHKSFPAAAGIMPDAVKNMVLLDYGSDEALEYIRDNADDIAGVLVETVQSRHPALVPVEFLHKLRELTKAQEIALIFDEVITGFRIAPGGFQEFVGIQADVCAYGKVIGGGISLGIIAGCNKYMDTLDGGTWQFGDDSKPEVGVTYFAGTFVRHPLALAAAKAVLLHLKQQGPQLQRGVNEKAAQFAADLNLHFKRVNAPIEIEQFCSMMYFKFTEDLPWGELMFCDMRRQGIHAWYGRPMFVSCAHTDDDLAKIRSAFMRSLARMQEWGFIPGSSRDDMGRELAPPVVGAKLGMDAAGNPAWFVEDPTAPNGLRQVSASFE
jgi:glutamate-1-semialdehyde aminotransferase